MEKDTYNAQNSAASGAAADYATMMNYGNYGPYSGAYNDFYKDYMLMPGVTGIVKRCAAGPFTYSSNPDLAAVCSTIPQDALDKVDCRRVERLRYTTPAYGACGEAPQLRYGAPQLKYPIVNYV